MEDITKIWYYENVSERIGKQVFASTIEIATEEQIQEARQLNSKGKCPHTIVVDEEGWMYDFRSCAICGKGLGLI
jgi:hypothetical protein